LQCEVASPNVTSSPADNTVRISQTGKAGQMAAHCTESAITARNNEFSRGRRDVRVDTLRGLLLIVMMVDHLPYYPLLRFSPARDSVLSLLPRALYLFPGG